MVGRYGVLRPRSVGPVCHTHTAQLTSALQSAHTMIEGMRFGGRGFRGHASIARDARRIAPRGARRSCEKKWTAVVWPGEAAGA